MDGERTTMRPGDFIITPSWTWHDHGNDADVPVVWLDGLDIPMIRFFDAGFAQNDMSKSQPVTRSEGTSLARYGRNMAPMRGDTPFGATSPIFSYPYDRTREALHLLQPHRVGGVASLQQKKAKGSHREGGIRGKRWTSSGCGVEGGGQCRHQQIDLVERD